MTVPSLATIPTHGRAGVSRQAAAAGGVTFLNDTLTDTDAVGLPSHTGETGATWTMHPSYANVGEIRTNRWRNDTSASTSCCYASGIPGSANYSVAVPLFVVSNASGQTIGPCGRMSTVANTFYTARYSATPTAWQLFKFIAGSGTQLGSDSVQALSGSNTYTVKLLMVGDQISLLVDDVLKVGPITDAAISAAGVAGVRGAGTTVTSSAGLHMASISGTTV